MKNTLLFLIFTILLGNILSNNILNENISHHTNSKTLLNESNEYSDKFQGNIIELKNFNTNNISISKISSKLSQRNIKAQIHIKKIHNFQRITKGLSKISFNIIFYFIRKYIPKNINFKLVIIYITNVRNQQKNESVNVSCIISNNHNNEIIWEGIGETREYECEALTLSNNNIKEIIINLNYPLYLDKEEISFDLVNFDLNSAKPFNYSDESKIKSYINSVNENLIKKRILNYDSYSPIIIKKIHNYERKQNQVSFKIFFYFFGKKIVRNIFLRIKII